ncbi:MAG: hypothetical protein ACE5G0_19775, partial [Rhodothermales bacterium]
MASWRSSTFYLPALAALWALSLMQMPAVAQPVQRLETAFERDINRFRWTSNAYLAFRVAGWDLELTNRFLSDAFILFEDQLTFRDEDLLQWNARRSFSPTFSAHLRGRTAWFGKSQVFSQEVYAGLRMTPRAFAWIEPVVGVAWDRRPGVIEPDGSAPLRLDAGPAYGVRLSLTPPPMQGYRLRLGGESAWQVMAPRRGRSVRLNGSAERRFEETRLASTLRVSSIRRDVYQAVSFLNRAATTDRSPESIEATTSDTLEVQVELDTPFYKGIRLNSRLDVAVNNRFIRTHRAPEETLFFETDFNRRAIDAEVGLLYDTPGLTARLAAQGGAATERRRLSNRDALPPAEA